MMFEGCSRLHLETPRPPVGISTHHTRTIGSPVGGPHSAGEIREAAAVNVLSRVFAFAAHGGRRVGVGVALK
jgi:hypothetical protein